MRILEPLPGRPAAIRALAQALCGSAGGYSDVGRAVGALNHAALWEGPAGEAFGAKAVRVPGLLDAAAARYAACASSLRTLADSLERAQGVIARAIETDSRCSREYVRLESRVEVLEATTRASGGLTGAAVDAAVEVAGLRTAQQRLLEEQSRARAEYDRVVAEHADTDRRCAARLRAASDDVLADSRTYLALRAAAGHSRTSEILEGAGMLLPPVGAAVGVTNAVSEGLLQVFYDEGSRKSVAINGSLSMLGGWGKVLRRAATVGSRVVVTGAGRTVVRQTRYTPTERVAVAARQQVSQSVRARLSAFTDPRIRYLPGGGLGGRNTASALHGLPPGHRSLSAPARSVPLRLKSAALERVNTKVLDDIRIARAGGRTTQRMYVAGITLEGGAKGGQQLLSRAEHEDAGSGQQRRSLARGSGPAGP